MRFWPVLILAALLAGCAAPLTQQQARATAELAGCWPYGADQPATPTPPGAGAAAYPTCTPLPGTPTITPRPTVPPTPTVRPTPPPLALLGGRATLGQQPGQAVAWARATRTPALAAQPNGRAAVAWMVWGGGPDPYAGDVWVRAQTQPGEWADSQTLNQAPVRSFFGGLALTWALSDTLAVAYGAGGQSGDASIYLARSPDAGASWGSPEQTGLRGRALGLANDAAGALYLLALIDGPGLGRSPPDVLYGYAALARRAPRGGWQLLSMLPGGLQYGGELALVEQAGAAPMLYAILTDWDRAAGLFPSAVTLAGSADGGRTWRASRLNDAGQVQAGAIVSTSLAAARRPDGTIVVAGAWGQTPGPGPAAGAVQARVSLDGAASWGPVETIAQHRADGRFGDDPQAPALLGGFEPSLAYDAATDRLAAAWIEDDLGRREQRALAGSNRSVRTLLAARALEPGAGWQFAVTPDADGEPLELAGWGLRGALWAAPGGTAHWLTLIDERNAQARVLAEPVALAALVAAP